MSDDLVRTVAQEGVLPASESAVKKKMVFAGPFECVVDEDMTSPMEGSRSMRGSHFVIRDLEWETCVLGLRAMPEGIATFNVVSGGGNTRWYWEHTDSRRRTARIRLVELVQLTETLTTELRRAFVEEGTPPDDGTYIHGPLLVEVTAAIKPSDDSDALSVGRYTVRDLKWIAWTPNDPTMVQAGVATFVVAQPGHDETRRRIAGVRVLHQGQVGCGCQNCQGLANFLRGEELP